MTARNLLAQLRELGIEVKTAGDDRLVIDAPKGAITPDLRSALATHKTELLEILKTESAETQPAAVAAESSAPVSRLTAPVAAARNEDEIASASTAEEIKQLEIQLMRLRTEEEARRAEVEAARLASENALREEQARWRQAEEEAARLRAEQEKQRIQVEARERAEEQNRRQIAEQELARGEEELKRMRAMEAARRADIEAQWAAAEEARRAELEKVRRAEDEQGLQRAEEERRYLDAEARKRSQEDELRRRAAERFRAVEEEILRVKAREDARLKSTEESQRLIEEAARRRVEEEARRQAEADARRRAEEEAQLRARIEAEVRAEAETKRKAAEETQRRAEEEARRRAEEEAQRLAAEEARRRAEQEGRERAEQETRRQAEEEARRLAEEDARRQAEEEARLKAAEEARQKAEDEALRRAEMEARIRAEVEAKIRAEEAERREREEARRRIEEERLRAEQSRQAPAPADHTLELERSEAGGSVDSKSTEIVEWFDVGRPHQPVKEIEEIAPLTLPDDQFPRTSFPGLMQDDAGAEFKAVSVPETTSPEATAVSDGTLKQLRSEKSGERAAAVADLARFGGEDAFRHINAAFDDQSAEVRSAAARALFELQEDRAAVFTRALREATPERRRRIGSALATSGLANEAIKNLTGESRDRTYDAFSLLFLMSKAGEVQPLMRAIEEHPNIEVRLAVVKLLALSGPPDILPAFRRMAVRGSLPPEVRSAVMEAIYQITSQSPAETPSMQ